MATNTFVIALSGGVDSVVLLHFLKTQADKPLRAIHINHHLSPKADKWVDFNAKLCAKMGVGYQCFDVEFSNIKNLEHKAREKRYKTLFTALKEGEVLCTAHHQEDQAETLLLQLLRGAGVAGLAAMEQYAKHHHRPLLDWSKQDILDYANQHKLSWIEDDSNLNPHFRRNFLRLNIIPKLKQVFPGVNKTLARSANHLGQSLELLTDLAAIDISSADLLNKDKRLVVSRLLKFSKPRVSNIIRYYLKQQGVPSLNNKRLTDFIHQLKTARVDARIFISWQTYAFRVYQDQIYLIKPKQKKLKCRLTDHLQKQAGVEVRHNQQVGRVIISGKTHSNSLKKLYQQYHIPAWIRPQLAMYYKNNKLIAIEKLGFLTEK